MNFQKGNMESPIFRIYGTSLKEVFRVPSSTQDKHYLIEKVHTTDDTYVYKCECIGYLTNKHTQGFECKHIKSVREWEKENK